MLEVMCHIFQSRYLRSNVAHKQLARTSLSAAFNTIDHQILLNVLASYLSDRTQRVLIKDQSSGDFQLNCGVPQGNCLGPVLFTLYVSGSIA